MACDLAVQDLFPKEYLSRKKMLLKLFSSFKKKKEKKTWKLPNHNLVAVKAVLNEH